MNSSTTMGSAESAVRNVADGSHATFKTVKEDLINLKRDTVGAIHENVGSGVEVTKDKYTEMCEYVRKNPTTSMLIALGVGAFAARLLRR